MAASDNQNLLFLPQQELSLDPIRTDHWILDIGGGGEGVIAQLMGRSVIAIDRRAGELQEALEASGDDGDFIRIIMDARDLKFLDGTFHFATCFFSLMYMDDDEQRTVLAETLRVMKPGGELLVWEFQFPVRGNNKEDHVAYPLLIHLPDKDIETGYGCRWPDKVRDLEHYRRLIAGVGFEEICTSQEGMILTLRCRKPDGQM